MSGVQRDSRDAQDPAAHARLRRWRLRTLTLVAVPAGVLAAAAFASQTRGPAHLRPAPEYFAAAPTIGSVAGYRQLDPVVHDISATITVPRIIPSPSWSYKDAATWVGAQVYGQNYLHLPFIQVGITEDESGDLRPTYEAFWSDNAHHFNAVPLFSVKPGARVSVRITHTGLHWVITAADGAKHRRILTSQERGGTFIAEWLQEDSDVGSRWYMYPKLTDIHMSQLLINGQRLSPGSLYPDWMSLGRAVVAFTPTPLTGDAFAVVPTRAGLRALRRIDANRVPWITRRDLEQAVKIMTATFSRHQRSLRAIAPPRSGGSRG